MKVIQLSIEGTIRKGYLFCQKWYIKNKWLDFGKTLSSTSPPLLGYLWTNLVPRAFAIF